MRVEADIIEKFVTIEDENIVNNNIIEDLNHNDELHVTRQSSKHGHAPMLPAGAPRQYFAVREGLIEGAREWALTGTPARGGVLRWEIERAPISTYNYDTCVPTHVAQA